MKYLPINPWFEYLSVTFNLLPYNFWTGSTGKRWWSLQKTFLKTNGSKLQYCISLDFGVERICFTIGKLYQLLSLSSENNFNHRRIIASKGRTKNLRWIYTTSIWHSDHSTNFPSKGGKWYLPKNGFLSTSWFSPSHLAPWAKLPVGSHEMARSSGLKNESSFSEFVSVSQTVFFLESDEFLSKMKHFDSLSERLLNLRPTHETPSKNPAPVATISTQRDVDLRYVARVRKIQYLLERIRLQSCTFNQLFAWQFF